MPLKSKNLKGNSIERNFSENSYPYNSLNLIFLMTLLVLQT